MLNDFIKKPVILDEIHIPSGILFRVPYSSSFFYEQNIGNLMIIIRNMTAGKNTLTKIRKQYPRRKNIKNSKVRIHKVTFHQIKPITKLVHFELNYDNRLC